MGKYTVQLTKEQRKYVEEITRKGEESARKIMHAQILLKTDKGPEGPRWSDTQIREAFGLGETILKVVRKRFVEEGLDAALEQPKRPQKQKLDGRQEAQIIAILCTEQKDGH